MLLHGLVDTFAQEWNGEFHGVRLEDARNHLEAEENLLGLAVREDLENKLSKRQGFDMIVNDLIWRDCQDFVDYA